MRRRLSVVAVLGAVAIAAAPTNASERTLRDDYAAKYRQVEHRFGDGSAGRNIVKDGVARKGPDRPATNHEVAESIRTMRTMLHPPAPVVTATSATTTSVPVTSGSYSGGGAAGCGASCQQCESGGNPQAVSPAGYWGKYQFDRQTWEAHGGDPGSYGSAGGQEQDRVASNIKYDAWPNC